MSNQKLGVTATELFACNPFRILGIPVNASESEISAAYKKLLAMAGTPEGDSYTTEFDFPSLPSFKRDEKTIKTAYAKLASNGYRCFAYSDGIFSQALNTDDVMLNLNDITCYDCFLRCYMWLITNDRNFEEPELWVPLCRYIDKMIMSSPEQWEKYFDNRFPENTGEDKMSVLRLFYTTFCDIILLPIKEMVRGSMRCKTAIDILKAAKVDVDEEFPYIEIPQANLPRNGEKPPKLKIAVKDGEEYFDITTGKTVSFESENESAVESNSFAAAATTISADAIVGDSEQDDLPIPDEPSEPYVEPVNVPKAESVFTQPVEPVKPTMSEPTFTTEPVQPAVQKPVEPPKFTAAPEQKPVQSEPVQNTAAFDPFSGAPTSQSGQAAPKAAAPVKRTKPKLPGMEDTTPVTHTEDIVVPTQRRKVSIPSKTEQPAQSSAQFNTEPVSAVFTAPSGSSKPAPAPVTSDANRKPYKKSNKGLTLTSIIDDVDKKTNESAEILLSEEEENDELYTDALIKMLRANRSNKLMKEADTSHIFDNGDSLEAPEKSDISMASINMKKFDKKLLDSPYENTKNLEKMDPKAAMAEKYKNISINDMINPTVSNKLQREYKPDAFEEYKKQKAEQKNMYSSMIKLGLILLLILAIIMVFFYFGIL